MAYDRAKIYQQAKEAIEKHKLFFIDDIVAFLPIARSTFYEWELDKSDELKELLDKNRIEVKSSLRSKWYKSNAPALQLALYKLIASPEEHRSLQMNYQDVTSEGKQVNVISLGTGKNPDETTG
jgi:hypothetical protein